MPLATSLTTKGKSKHSISNLSKYKRTCWLVFHI